MRRAVWVAVLAVAMLMLSGCGEGPLSGTTTTVHEDPELVTTTTRTVITTTAPSYDPPDDDSYEYSDDEPGPSEGEGGDVDTGITFVDDWSLERGEIVAYGPGGAMVFDWIEGTERRLTDDGLAGLVAGPWGLVFQAAGGDEPRESTAPIWWVADADSEPERLIEGEGSLMLATDDLDNWGGLMELYDVIEWNEELHAVVRLEAYQNDDLWILQPLSGGPPHEMGFLSGGEAEASCVAWDGTDLFLAIDAHDSAISRRSLTGEWSPFLPGGPEDVWPNASTCIAARPGGGFVVLLEEWPNEQGIDPPPRLLVLLDSSGEIDTTLELTDLTGLVRVDATDNGFVLLSELDGFHWLSHEEGEHPSPLATDLPFARFVD